MCNAATELIHEALGCEPSVVQACQVPAARCQKNTFVAVGFLYAGQMAGQHIQSFIPGDTFEFAFTTLTDPFLRVHQSLRMVDILPECPATQTGPELLRFANIVALDPHNSIVFDMQLERAASAAVEGGCGAYDFNITIRLTDIFIAHFSLLTIKLC
jgi:hypothetical protein